MKKMSESTDNEMLLLMKELVSKVNELEKAVYNKDNLLMKSGYVVANTPVPTTSTGGTTVDDIAKMDWADINEMVARMEGSN
tara:strand:+ start:1629 stop:1874 length:246 start_codon:yes stop_codon:yes gene_type:complete